MTKRIRPLAALGSVLALMIAALTFAAPAGAAPYVEAASISLSAQAACTSVGVSGTGFAPGSAVAFSLGTSSLGSATADANGAFSVTVSLPSGLSGLQTLVAAQGDVTASAGVTIDCAAAGGAGGGGGGGSGGLPNTGVAVIGIGVLGLVLLIGGAAMLLAGKRRRVSA